VFLFDSRPLTDFRLGHVAQARPLPLDELVPVAEDFDDDALRRLAAALGAAGFDPDAAMVVTGGGGPAGLRRAAAGCWLLTLAGATRCSVLIGGIEAGHAAGATPVAGRAVAGAGSATPRIPARPPGLATQPYLREATARPEGAVVDVRSPVRGRSAPTSAGSADGWIPGALSWPLPDPGPADRRVGVAAPFDRAAPFDLAALERSAAAAGLFAERDLVVVGESFHDGALGWFLLRYGLGVRDAKLFPGGIAAWRRDASLPFTGDAPDTAPPAAPAALAATDRPAIPAAPAAARPVPPAP
jgi:3-mercaptopyruvate sulfurtransferase SseA